MLIPLVNCFVLPSYFTEGDQKGRRNDFLGLEYNGQTLRSFGVNPGGYINYLDLDAGEWTQYFNSSDKLAQKRLSAKSQLKSGRRSRRIAKKLA